MCDLQRHFRRHTDDKPFKCELCDKGFFQSSDLQRHVLVHTGERPYKCPVCGKGFRRNDTLKAHQWTHTSLKRDGKIRTTAGGDGVYIPRYKLSLIYIL